MSSLPAALKAWARQKGKAEYKFSNHRNLWILTALPWYFYELTEIIEPKKLNNQAFLKYSGNNIDPLNVLKFRLSVKWYYIVMITHAL